MSSFEITAVICLDLELEPYMERQAVHSRGNINHVNGYGVLDF